MHKATTKEIYEQTALGYGQVVFCMQVWASRRVKGFVVILQLYEARAEAGEN